MKSRPATLEETKQWVKREVRNRHAVLDANTKLYREGLRTKDVWIHFGTTIRTEIAAYQRMYHYVSQGELE